MDASISQGAFLVVFASILMLHREQQVAVYREGPPLGGGQLLQPVRQFTGLFHIRD